MKHTLTIHGWQPTPTNKLLRMYWAQRNRVLKGDYAVIKAEALCQGIPPATGARRVSLVICHKGRSGKVDGDALWKVLLDALVHAGLLLGDAPGQVVQGAVTHEESLRKGLVVVLEDVDGAQELSPQH